MSERIAVVTPAELEFFTSLEATRSYDALQYGARETDPRYLPGDLIGYAAGLITAVEILMADHHGQPPATRNIPRKLLRTSMLSSPQPSQYTVNDLLANPTTLNNPPLILETSKNALPSSKFAVKPEQHLLGFLTALLDKQEADPEVDKDSLEDKIIYNTGSVDADRAELVAARSPSDHDPLTASIRGLLRLREQCNEVYIAKQWYRLEGFLDLPDRLTTTTENTLTGIITKKTCRILGDGTYRLRNALLEARPKQDENNT